jgi:8-oxo-dGTP pyrophosphatase MutT (NUDIX family)
VTITLERVRRTLRAYRPTEQHAAEARPAAVALILVEDTSGVAALFIRRAERSDDPWSGQVALPGGRRDPGDGDLLATAIRETREEVDVDLERAERLGTLDDLYPRTPTLPPVIVRPFVFALLRRPLVTPGAEVERAFWLPLGELSRPGVRRDITLTVRGVGHTLPAYQVGTGLVLWGMTERIVTPFLELVSASSNPPL